MVGQFGEYLDRLPYEKTGDPVKGAPVAYGNYVEKPAKGNILLIGDAAGLVDPLTGEGIYFAILSGRFAFGALRGSDPADGYLKKTKKIHKVIREMNLAKGLFFARPLHPLCLRAIEKRPEFIGYVLEHLISEYDTAVRRLPFLILRPYVWGMLSPRMYMGLGCGIFWIGCSPMLIKRYIRQTGEFFDTYESSSVRDKDSAPLRSAFDAGFLSNKTFFVFYFLWAVCVEAAVFFDPSYMERFGFGGLGDPYFYLFCICLLYVLYLTAAGFAGVFNTAALVYKLVSDKYLKVDYLNVDGQGGMKFISDYVMSTTRLFATGMLFIPIVLDYIYYTSYALVKILLYLILAVYGLGILLIYAVSMKLLYDYSTGYKCDYLKSLKEGYKTLLSHTMGQEENGNEEEELRALNLYHYISLVDSASSFNLKYGVIRQLLELVVLPVASLLFNLGDILNLLKSFWFY